MIIELWDGRKAICYKNNQPLKDSGRTILHLVDEQYNPIRDEAGKPKTIFRSANDYQFTIIGFVD